MSGLKSLSALWEIAGHSETRIDQETVVKACERIQAEIKERYMLLPLDADGVPIRIGDVVQFRNDAPVIVGSIGASKIYENDTGFFGSNGGFYGQGTLNNIHHVNQRTLENVLAEVENGELSIADAAFEIRELLGGDAE